jgi:uncharacterized protein
MKSSSKSSIKSNFNQSSIKNLIIMKNLIRTSLSVVASLFITVGCVAQKNKKEVTSKNENSLLWEISGKGIEKPSYLYGTIHMICDSDFIMKEKVTKAFEKTSKLAIEVNFNDAEEMSVMQKSLMGKTPLSKELSEQQSKELDEILQKSAGMTLNQVDNFTMATIMSLISMKSFGCTNLKLYEMEFIAKAKAANKTIIGLEKVQAQIDFLNNAYNNQEMITMLKETNKEETKKLVQHYLQEDILGLYSNITDKKVMNAKTKSFMLDQRNNNWVKLMPELMKKESVFFAFGAAHLSGEEGIINLLRNAGYTVKPILN